MSTLRYHDGEIDDLGIGECVIRPTRDGADVYLGLWFRDRRVTDGQPQNFGAPVNPGGSYSEAPRRTWGLKRTAPGTWQVSPSINVLVDGEAHPGEPPTKVSIWHETPMVVAVPEPPPWERAP